jgi:hypothetical protein
MTVEIFNGGAPCAHCTDFSGKLSLCKFVWRSFVGRLNFSERLSLDWSEKAVQVTYTAATSFEYSWQFARVSKAGSM